jgi:hypothetical protein
VRQLVLASYGNGALPKTADFGEAMEVVEAQLISQEVKLIRGSHLLWLGRYIQHPATGVVAETTRPKGRQYSQGQAGHHCIRKYRLHYSDWPNGGYPNRAHVELLDWATGGPRPVALGSLQ